jgi:hypothetical protein
VQTFADSREAKEFLVGEIVAESHAEGIPLSEVERKMLYFSEVYGTLPDILEVNEAFDREYDQTKYEEKIRRLANNIRTNASNHDPKRLKLWNEAARILRREDHYILVLIDAANSTGLSIRRFLTLLAIALILAGALVLLYGLGLIR